MSHLDELAEAIAFAHDAESPANGPLATTPQSPEASELERVAALAAAASAPPELLPESLSCRLAADALAFCATVEGSASDDVSGQGLRKPALRDLASSRDLADSHDLETNVARASEAPQADFTTPRPRNGATGNLLSFVVGALAAGLVVWLALSDSHQRSLAEVRAEALANNPAIQRQEWAPGPSPRRGEVTGDVVWSQKDQDGWLTFRNLPALPADQAYQLWIVDGERDGAPVDGGLFTIAASEETTVVPIQARLPIGKPAAFVITIEGKQGVVVSKQEHVVAIASL